MPKFNPGNIMFTQGAVAAFVPGEAPILYLVRHVEGDWGEVDEEDKQTNDESIISGGGAMSVYMTQNGTKLWIITDADRATTTFLLPDEY